MTLRATKPLIQLLMILVIGCALDVATKRWAQQELLTAQFHAQQSHYPACTNDSGEQRRANFVVRNGKPIGVIPNFFQLRYVENCASAFNLMENVPEGIRFPFFIFISLLACVIVPVVYTKTPASQIYTLYALPFILAGALGNLTDRMIYRYVIDFIDNYIVLGGKSYHWPTFNIADGAIAIGIGLMLYQLFIGEPNKHSVAKAAAPTTVLATADNEHLNGKKDE